MHSWNRQFSHIYIERAARDYPWTKRLLRRFPRAEKIEIRKYGDVFGRRNQNFQLQKRSLNLIVALKHSRFLYPGSANAQDFGYPNFYYNTLVLNCLYNCDYCYLQGLYPSANIVVFVNIEDFFNATRRAIKGRADATTPVYLAISYDTDLLAFEPILPYCQEWLEFSCGESDLIIELRTKSAHSRILRRLTPHRNAVIAWTLSPNEVVEKYERLTPSLQHRLEAARETAEAGWPVRLCFDPVLKIPQWKEAYRRCIESSFEVLPPDLIQDVSVGVFRMNADQFKRLKKARDDTDLLFHPYTTKGPNRVVTYAENERTELVQHLRELIQSYVPAEKIETWM